ncbi:MAG: UDP-N-acetylglucosamine diphosphorylase/glucosamine-1-phosphate N-acetyltransferase [Chloroflexi bacterium]|nr:UDP-N-acetylglucosamine diphosphorylase/glucosamine-1-phosphate N-acetyltransferase [Chloroflexota bacterium]
MTLDVIILAAGKGTRMKSRLPKVLHPVAGQPMILYSVEVAQVASHPPVLIIGHGSDAVKEIVGDRARYVMQQEQLGTGHAVMQAQSTLEGHSNAVLVIYGDMPLLRAETLQALYEAQQAHTGPFSMLTNVTDTPRGFGRILRDENGFVTAIVEEAHATVEQRAIREVNLGIYCFDAAWLWAHLKDIPISPKGEYYLTDLVEIAVREGGQINALPMTDSGEVLGVNTRVHLAEAEAEMQRRINERWMLAGVTLIDPSRTVIHAQVQIGQDTVIWPDCYLLGETVIGEACRIGPNSTLLNANLGDRCQVQYSVIEYATLEDDVDVGPFGHLRKGAYLEAGVHMGNFGEVKNSRLRRGVKMGHFGYLGDADVGEDTNIGAGTITANYDGMQKHKTQIGRDVFIGSDTVLVAPVIIGDQARTGAGAVVTRDVDAGNLVLGVPAKPRPKDEHKPQEETQ